MMRRLIAISIIVCSLLVSWFWMMYENSINDSYISNEMGSVVVNIEKGENLNQIISTLNEKGVVDGRWFKWLVRFEGAANKIQAGE